MCCQDSTSVPSWTFATGRIDGGENYFGGRALDSVLGLLPRATRNNGKSDRSLNFVPFYYCKIEVETDKK